MYHLPVPSCLVGVGRRGSGGSRVLVLTRDRSRVSVALVDFPWCRGNGGRVKGRSNVGTWEAAGELLEEWEIGVRCRW
jgi:hypothetical protein